MVRQNSANTDTYPNLGSGDLLLLWDALVDSAGSTITYSSGIFTLGETGHFLVMVSDRAATTHANRTSGKMTMTLGSTELREGHSTFWRRDTTENHDSCIAMSVAIINVTSTAGTNDDLTIRVERIDNQTASPAHNRVATESGITIIKLDDANSFARYESATPWQPSTSDNTRVVQTLGTTLEETGPFTRTGNVVDIATTNPVVAIYTTQKIVVPGSGRHEYQSDLRLNGTAVPGGWNQYYPRHEQDTDMEAKTTMVLLYPTSGDDLELGFITRELGVAETWRSSLQLWELPSGATTATLEAITGDMNVDDVAFVWDTVKSDTSSDFTLAATSADIECEFAGEAIVMSGQAYTQNAAEFGQRSAPGAKFYINGEGLNQAGCSNYNRDTGTAGHVAISMCTLITGIVANDDLRVHNIRMSDVTTQVVNEEGAFSAIRLSSLFS